MSALWREAVIPAQGGDFRFGPMTSGLINADCLRTPIEPTPPDRQAMQFSVWSARHDRARKMGLMIEQTLAAGTGSRGRTPELRLLYETAPVGLAFLTPDCRYQLINRRLCEICGISVDDHIGRSVRETVPQVAQQVENIVRTILKTGKSITGIEISGQRPDGGNPDRVLDYQLVSSYCDRRQHPRYQRRIRGDYRT